MFNLSCLPGVIVIAGPLAALEDTLILDQGDVLLHAVEIIVSQVLQVSGIHDDFGEGNLSRPLPDAVNDAGLQALCLIHVCITVRVVGVRLETELHPAVPHVVHVGDDGGIQDTIVGQSDDRGSILTRDEGNVAIVDDRHDGVGIVELLIQDQEVKCVPKEQRVSDSSERDRCLLLQHDSIADVLLRVELLDLEQGHAVLTSQHHECMLVLSVSLETLLQHVCTNLLGKKMIQHQTFSNDFTTFWLWSQVKDLLHRVLREEGDQGEELVILVACLRWRLQLRRAQQLGIAGTEGKVWWWQLIRCILQELNLH